MDASQLKFDSQIGRRASIAALGTVLLGGVGVSTITEEASADNVELGDFNIESAEYEAEDPEVVPQLDVDGNFEYTVEQSPDEYEARLLVGTLEADDVIDTDSGSLSAREGHSDYDLSSVVTDSGEWNAITFEVDRGETVNFEVAVAVEFDVIRGSSVQASERVEAVAPVSVTNTGETNIVSINADGEVSFEEV